MPSPDTRHIQESDEAPRHPQAPSVTNNPYGDLPPSDDAIEFYPSPVNEDQDEDQDEDMSDAPPLLDHGKVDDEPEPTPDSVMPELPLPEDGAAGGGSHLREAIQYAVTNRRGLLFRPSELHLYLLYTCKAKDICRYDFPTPFDINDSR